jgi:hypothetical protein
MGAPRLVLDDPKRQVPFGEEPMRDSDLSSFLDEYRPMLRLLSAADIAFLRREGYSHIASFRRQRAVIYFQYLMGLCRDLRALPLWTAPHDAEAFMELDKAAWTVQKLLLKLALEGALYYIGVSRRDSSLTERCFEKLGTLLNAAA